VEAILVSKQYFCTARSLRRIAGNITDETIASRLKTLAENYERRAHRAELAEQAEALAPVVIPGDTEDWSNSKY
jgi:hypothetical protein